MTMSKKIDERFNQVIVNWYEGKDLIPRHVDWTDNMIPNYCIGMISLYGTNDKYRILELINRQTKEKIKFEFKNGDLVLMCGNCQEEFQHSIGAASDGTSRRIGISFRQYV